MLPELGSLFDFMMSVVGHMFLKWNGSAAAMQSSTFQFLEAFSNLVTMRSSKKNDWLARTGSYSIHALLSQIVPEVRTVRR